MSEFEKELAVLRGRVDGLESELSSLQNAQRAKSSVLIIDEFDIETENITKSVKSIRSGVFPWIRFSRLTSNNKALVVSEEQAVVFDENNTNGIWRTIRVYDTTFITTTGKDLIIGVPHFDGEYYYNVGGYATNEGGRLIINKQQC